MNIWLEVIVQLYKRFKEHELLPGSPAQLLLGAGYFLSYSLITLLSYAPVSSDMPCISWPVSCPGMLMSGKGRIERRRLAPYLNVHWYDYYSMGGFYRCRALIMVSTGLLRKRNPLLESAGLSLLFTLALALIMLFAFVMLIFGRIMGEPLYLISRSLFYLIWRYIRYFIPWGYVIGLHCSTVSALTSINFPGCSARLYSQSGLIISSSVFAWYVEHFANYTSFTEAGNYHFVGMAVFKQ